jgi:hypothetical protein
MVWRKLTTDDEIVRVIQTARLMYLLSPYAFNIAILDFALQSFKIDNQPREYCAVIDLISTVFFCRNRTEILPEMYRENCHTRRWRCCAGDFAAQLLQIVPAGYVSSVQHVTCLVRDVPGVVNAGPWHPS